MSNQLCAEDLDEAKKLLVQLKAGAGAMTSHIRDLQKHVNPTQINTAKGVSFLEVRYQLLLSYLTDLTLLMCHKINGRSISGHASVDRLVEIRTVLEKMRPIDQKLKYQIDKLIKTATTGIGENDPLRYKPNPAALVSKLDEAGSGGGSDSDGEEATEGSGTAKYRPPKLHAMHYEGDDTELDRQTQAVKQRDKRFLSSSLMRELKEQYSDAPQELKEDLNLHKMREDKAGRERQEYEEKYFMRMPVTKKQKTESRRLATVAGLDSITDFGSMAARRESATKGSDSKTRKRKMKGKGKSKGSKKKRFK